MMVSIGGMVMSELLTLSFVYRPSLYHQYIIPGTAFNVRDVAEHISIHGAVLQQLSGYLVAICISSIGNESNTRCGGRSVMINPVYLLCLSCHNPRCDIPIALQFSLAQIVRRLMRPSPLPASP